MSENSHSEKSLKCLRDAGSGSGAGQKLPGNVPTIVYSTWKHQQQLKQVRQILSERMQFRAKEH